ncbi:hypothetical protein AMECASPLE_034597, partial [Ameca splendens]
MPRVCGAVIKAKGFTLQPFSLRLLNEDHQPSTEDAIILTPPFIRNLHQSLAFSSIFLARGSPRGPTLCSCPSSLQQEFLDRHAPRSCHSVLRQRCL